jgi:Transposase DDE domain
VQLAQKTGRTSASAFLEVLIATVPYKIHTVLTDNGIQFTFPPRYASGPAARYMTHMFDMRCRESGIIKRSDQAQAFELLPRRWVVERTFAWLNRCRRLAKDFDNLTRNALAFLRLASIRLMLRKLGLN